jgi:hypothetical protein
VSLGKEKSRGSGLTAARAGEQISSRLKAQKRRSVKARRRWGWGGKEEKTIRSEEAQSSKKLFYGGWLISRENNK